jgi:hypothetical protein
MALVLRDDEITLERASHIGVLGRAFPLEDAKQTLSRQLRAMGYRKLSARPRHHAQADGAIEDFKKRMARPSADQARLAAGGNLSRYQPEPGREIAAAGEGLAVVGHRLLPKHEAASDHERSEDHREDQQHHIRPACMCFIPCLSG